MNPIHEKHREAAEEIGFTFITDPTNEQVSQILANHFPESPTGEGGFAWVVEHKDSDSSMPRYFTGIEWSNPGDNLSALRFSREKDALIFAEKLDWPIKHRAAEHGWISKEVMPHAQRTILRRNDRPQSEPTGASPQAEPSGALELEWRDGYPSKPWSSEWFIAEITNGDRAVLIELPKEYSYHFKTIDDTYYLKDRIRRWMQFPNSNYIAPSPRQAEPRGEKSLVDIFHLAYDAKDASNWSPNDVTHKQECTDFAIEAVAAEAVRRAGIGVNSLEGEMKRQITSYYELAEVLKRTKEERQEKTAQISSLRLTESIAIGDLQKCQAENESLLATANADAILAVERQMDIKVLKQVLQRVADLQQTMYGDSIKTHLGLAALRGIIDAALGRKES